VCVCLSVCDRPKECSLHTVPPQPNFEIVDRPTRNRQRQHGGRTIMKDGTQISASATGAKMTYANQLSNI
jgi:hypothetical protein